MILNNYHKRYLRTLLVFILSLSMFSGCIPYKRIVYMQKKPNAINTTETFTVPTYIYTIAKGDILGIDISTFTKGSINNISENIAPKTSTSGTDPMQNGYVVDDNGAVNLPIMGLVTLEGLTLPKAQEIILKKSAEYINNPVIKIRMLSFYITVLGEVAKAGRLQITTPSINIFEALALSGDIVMTANHHNIRVIRIIKDQATTYYVDINSADVFKSEVFYLKPGDMIYVEPARVKVAAQNLTALGIGTTLLSTVFFIVNILIITKVIK